MTSVTISTRIRYLRTENDWTQAELARRAGVSLSAIQKLETKQTVPGYNALEKIAHAFNMDYDTFIAGINWKKRKQRPRRVSAENIRLAYAYYLRGMPIREVASRFGVHYSSIYGYFRSYNLPLRKARFIHVG